MSGNCELLRSCAGAEAGKRSTMSRAGFDTRSENRLMLKEHYGRDFLLATALLLLADCKRSPSFNVSDRNFPGGTSSAKGPYFTRLIFSTWCPTASNMRRIWRLRPSIKVISYQGLA